MLGSALRPPLSPQAHPRLTDSQTIAWSGVGNYLVRREEAPLAPLGQAGGSMASVPSFHSRGSYKAPNLNLLNLIT